MKKPRSECYRSEIIKYPQLHFWRRVFRQIIQFALRILVRLFTQVKLTSLENLPDKGPLLIVSNHLGDADLVVGAALTPQLPEIMAKAELYDFPVIGLLMKAYGVIWVHRGSPDRKALRIALRCLEEGRMVAIAPEGRESLNGSLEEGTNGAAFLAIKSGAPVLPITFTGTENLKIYPNMRRLRKSRITLTVGNPFTIPPSSKMRESVRNGTRLIMENLAKQLPAEYQGVYRNPLSENNHGI